MHIENISIQNIYSFEDAHFSFDRYNVIVGANNVGKTNLIRVLNLLRNAAILDEIRLPKRLKLNDGKTSQLSITFHFNDEEIQLILQTFFKKIINQKEFPDSLKILEVKINWVDLVSDNARPIHVIYRFKNDLTIIISDNDNVIFHFPSVESKKSEQEDLSSILQSKTRTMILNYFERFLMPDHDQDIWKDETLLKNMLEEKNLEDNFVKNPDVFYTSVDFNLRFDSNSPTEEASKVADYMLFEKSANTTFNFSNVINRIISNNLILIEEIPPTYEKLTNDLYRLKMKDDTAYDFLKKGFSEIFNGISFKVEQDSRQMDANKGQITFAEGTKVFPLEESASGHYAAIHILQTILNQQNRILLIDEPEIHFHPVKISQLSQKFIEISRLNNNQIIVFSHSPKFVNYDILDSTKSYSLTFVKKINRITIVKSTPKKFKMKLKKHLFNPEIFFGNCTMIVEGPADEFALKAISDHFEGLFEQNSITITNCWGVGNVWPNIELHNLYEIPFLAMVDKEYDKVMTDVIRLTGNLENEFRNLGWMGGGTHKLLDDEAYSFISELMKSDDGLQKIKKTDLWRVFATVIGKAGGKLPS